MSVGIDQAGNNCLLFEVDYFCGVRAQGAQLLIAADGDNAPSRTAMA